MPYPYPKKICKSTFCISIWFIPRRSNQLYCDGCKDHYHNTLRKIHNETDFAREKQLRNNAKRLEAILATGLYTDGVPYIIIMHEGIHLATYTDQELNEHSGGTIFWSHQFGIELVHDTPSKIFFIYKR